MTIKVAHSFVSAIADDPAAAAAGEVVPSNWNAGHPVTASAGTLFGFDASGNQIEVTVGGDATLSTTSGALVVTKTGGTAFGALATATPGTGVATALAVNTNATGGIALTTVAPTAWTPTDQSGAGLTFTSVSAMYAQIGNMVFAYGTLTYPATADASAAKISLPVAVPNQNYAQMFGEILSALGAGRSVQAVKNTSIGALVGTTGSALTNVTLSTVTITFMLIYPAS